MGKSSSKLKKKDRSQSVIWSFKFPAIGTLTRKMSRSGRGSVGGGGGGGTQPHMGIQQWLTALDLTQYEKLFQHYSGVEHLLDLTEADIKEMGVKNSAHRARIASSIVVLRNKYNKGSRTDKTQRHSMALEGARQCEKSSNAADLVLVSNVVQSKSLCNITMESGSDGRGAGGMDSSGLRKALEWELSLDTRDLRSHAWYHGAIPRTRAEEIILDDGDFLVRDCASQPGNYVLSTRCKALPLHFVINKVVLQPDTVYERVQFQFEDEPYDTVSDLITYYVGSGKPISALSGARIQTPKNRLHPLSFYASKYNLQSQSSPRYNTLQRGDAPPRLPCKNRPLVATDEKSNSADGVVKPKFLTNSLPRKPITRITSDPTLSPCLERRLFGAEDGPEPPPKPSRVPVMTDVDDGSRGYSGSDSGNGSGDSAQSSADATTPCATGTLSSGGTLVRGVVIKNPRYRYAYDAPLPSSASSLTLKADYDIPMPFHDLPSFYDLENYHTLLLPTLENKPVDQAALQCVRSLLTDTGSRVLANHLTRMDVEVTIGHRDNGKFGATSGLELAFLPHGRQARLDLIERTECTKLLVAISVLTCQTESERAETINKWIQVAIDTKTALGNLFGFCSIMLALCLPQVQRLGGTWHVLRQKFTDSAFNYEAKLRPTLKSMNECTNPQAPNTSIPHIIPTVLLHQRTIHHILGTTTSASESLSAVCVTPYESASDLGLSTAFAHLESSRRFAAALPSFRRNAEIVLGDSKVDPLLLDLFRTEFQLKFLWGSRGASADPHERHAKFDQVLTLMSEKCEPSGTAV